MALILNNIRDAVLSAAATALSTILASEGR